VDDFTKSQKKKVRELIPIGLSRDYADAIKGAKRICDSFVEGESDPREFYMKLYSTVKNKDKDIVRRYDDLTGSQYFLRLSVLVLDGVLTHDDIECLDAELKERLAQVEKSFRSRRST
jgi:hypothetical protein